MTTITAVTSHDVRFPTSLSADGSDAMNKDGDYSAAYVVIHTDDPALKGYGFTFTIGRGNDLCTEAARQRGIPLIGRSVELSVADLGAVYRELNRDSQLRWLGPDKGVEHLALAAVMNAMWDLAARVAGKPLWRLLADMTPQQLVDAADLSYLSDAITRDEAIAMLTNSSRPGPTASRSSPAPGIPATPPARDGSATATRSCGDCFRRRSTTATAT